MEIPELSLISNFEAGVNCLQNPSLFSRNFPPFASFSFWKWGALFIAFLASFRCIVARVKVLIIVISKRVKAFAASQPPIQLFGDDFDSDDDSDDACSSDSSDDIGCFYYPTSFRQNRSTVEEDFSVAGSKSYGGDSNCWDGFALSDLATGKGVVRFWDSLGLGFDFEDDSPNNVVSLWDSNKKKKLSSLNGVTGDRGEQIPAVILSGTYNRRIGLQNPSVIAEWTPAPAPSSPRRSKVVGTDKMVFVIDDAVSALTVGDMKNKKSPLRSVTESDGDKWWDTGR